MKNINDFNNGYSQGMFVMARDFEMLVEYLVDEDLSKKEIIEMIKEEVNSSLLTHVVNSGYSASTDGYEVFLKNNAIVSDKIKTMVQEELMDNE